MIDIPPGRVSGDVLYVSYVESADGSVIEGPLCRPGQRGLFVMATRYVSVPPAFTYIYALLCPFTDEVRYVGKADKPIERWKEHKGRGLCRKGNTPLVTWVAALRELKKEPKLQILSACHNSGWAAYERWWIAKLRKQGADLLNVHPGGCGSNGVGRWVATDV